MKKFLVSALVSLLLGLGFSALVSAQPVANEIHSFPLAILYNVQAATPAYIYCRTEGVARVGNDDNRRYNTSPILIGASGTTVVANPGGTSPFINVAVGDIVYFQDPSQPTKGATIERVVVTHPSNDTITISSLVSTVALNANSFEYRKRQCGTTAAFGWFPLEGYRPVKFSIAANTIGATSLEGRIECREQGEDAQPYPVCNNTNSGFCNAAGTFSIPAASAGIAGRNFFVVGVNDNWKECRVGLSITGAGVNSVTMRATTAR